MTKTITFLGALVLAALPAAAQPRTYTNADLVGTRIVAWTRMVTPAELAGLKAREFVLPRAVPPAPVVIVVSTSVQQPLYTPIRPLSEPWSMTTYLGRGHRRGSGHLSERHGPPEGSRPGIHLRYP
jgi:hypothetical protein